MAITQHFRDVAAGLEQLDMALLAQMMREARECRKIGGTLWLAGNGGSFATVQHIAADLIKAARTPAVALGVNAALLTACANDQSYDVAIGSEFALWAHQDDLLICLSCSGTSANIAALVSMAREKGVRSWLLTSTARERVAQADQVVRVWSHDYTVIEDCHMAIGHWLVKELTT